MDSRRDSAIEVARPFHPERLVELLVAAQRDWRESRSQAALELLRAELALQALARLALAEPEEPSE